MTDKEDTKAHDEMGFEDFFDLGWWKPFREDNFELLSIVLKIIQQLIFYNLMYFMENLLPPSILFTLFSFCLWIDSFLLHLFFLHLFIYLFIFLFIHLIFHLFTFSFIYRYIYSLIYSFIHLFIYLFIYLFI